LGWTKNGKEVMVIIKGKKPFKGSQDDGRWGKWFRGSEKEAGKMRRISAIICAAVLCFGMSGVAMAGNSDTITVTYEVQAINEIAIADASVSLIVSSATAGSAPTDATDSSSYAITTNCADNAKKLTVALNSAMPSGLTLKLTVAPPTGATGAGQLTLTASAQDAVTVIDAGNQSGLALDFVLSATAAAGVVSSAEKTLTLTLTDS
jgi:hypothetical protein